jgi:CRISPR-associated protein Cas8b1/Cst1 subtype I-B
MLLNNQSKNLNSFSISEQTRRVLSPYNQHLKNYFKKIKRILDRILNDMNMNSYSLKYLNKKKILN